MSEESCGNCRFWFGGSARYGDCRIRPPVVTNDDSDLHFPISSTSEWCGEWRAKAAAATGKLYQLPNGQWVTAADVSAVVVDFYTTKAIGAPDAPSPVVTVCFRDAGQHSVYCSTKEAADAVRDKIAADVNAMVGGA